MSLMQSLEERLEVSEVSSAMRVSTHDIYQVMNVSEDGRFVDIINTCLVWKEDDTSEAVVLNQFNIPVQASPVKPTPIFDVPVKQFKEGDLIISKRPKVGDVGYVEFMYQDIGTWKAEGGFQAPMSINIHDRSSCVFVNGVPNHKESDADPLPAENITQIKTKDISIEWQDTTDDESESHIKVKNGNIEYELKEVNGDNGIENTVTFKTKNVTFQIVDTADGANVTMSIPDNMTITAKKFIVNGETEFNGNSTLNGDNTTTGKITASDDVLGGGISLKDHSHDFNYIGAGQGSSQQSGTTEKPS